MHLQLTELQTLVTTAENSLPPPTGRFHRLLSRAKRFSRARDLSAQLDAAAALVEPIHAAVQRFVLLAAQNVSSTADDYRPVRAVPERHVRAIVSFQEGTLLGSLRAHLLNVSSDTAVFAIAGMGGIGKTTAMLALAHDPAVRTAFPGGTFFLSFGEEASPQTVVDELELAVRVSGGASIAKQIKEASDMMDAVRTAAVWFQDRRCLFLCDDLWPSVESPVGFSPCLQALVASDGNAMVLTTRDRDIASISADYITLSPLEARGETSCAMMLKHAGVSHSDFESIPHEFRSIFDQVLNMCGGVPLTLAVAGGTLGFWSQSLGSWVDALRKLQHSLTQTCSAISEKDLKGSKRYNYNFNSTVSTSLQSADAWAKCLAHKKLIEEFSCKHLFLRLGLLPHQANISDALLKRIWSTIPAVFVDDVLEAFLRLNLITAKRDQEAGIAVYELHDLLLNYAAEESKKNGMYQRAHRDFLTTYIPECNQNQPMCSFEAHLFTMESLARRTRPWWKFNIDSNPDDAFLIDNLARLLVQAGMVDELAGLLCNARWFLSRVGFEGVLGLSEDFNHLLRSLEVLSDKGMSANESTSRGLVQSVTILRGAICAMSLIATQNPYEIATQASSRLHGLTQSGNGVLQRFVETSIEVSSTPFLMSEERYWPDVYGTACIAVPLPGSCWNVGARFEADTALVTSYGTESVYEVSFLGNGVITHSKDFPQGDLQCFSMSPNGSMLCLFNGQSIRFWESQTDIVKWELDVDPDLDAMSNDVSLSSLRRQAWDSKGLFFVFGDYYGGLQCFDLRLKSHFVVSDDTKESIISVSASMKGERLASGDINGSIRYWCSSTATALWGKEKAHEGEVEVVCVTSDGARMISSDRSDLKLWLTSDGICEATHRTYPDYIVSSMFSGDGTRLVVTTAVGKVQWRNGHTGILLCQFNSPTQSTLAMCVSPDGRHAVTAGLDGVVRRWDCEGEKLAGDVHRTHDSIVNSVFLSNDGQKLLSCGQDLSAKVQSTTFQGKVETRELRNSGEDVICAAMSLDGNVVATGNSIGDVSWWNVCRSEMLDTLVGLHTGSVGAIAISFYAERTASIGDKDHKLMWCDSRKGSCLGHTFISDLLIDDVDWTSTKVKMAMCSKGSRCAIIVGTNLLYVTSTDCNLRKQTSIELTWKHKLRSIALCERTSLVVTGDNDGGVQVRKWGNKEIVWGRQKVHGTDFVLGVAMSKDARVLVSVGTDCTLRVWAMGRKRDDPDQDSSTASASTNRSLFVGCPADFEDSRLWTYEQITSASLPTELTCVAFRETPDTKDWGKIVVGDLDGGVWMHTLVL